MTNCQTKKYKNSLFMGLVYAVLFIISFTAQAKLLPFTSKYVAYYDGDDVGEAQLELNVLDDERYELNYQSSVSKFFLSDRRFETSIFTTENGKLIPIRYEYQREGTGRNKALIVEFDADSDKIIVNEEARYDWNNEFDNQLFRVDLPQRLKDGETKFDYYFINYRGERRHYQFELLGDENVQLPYGQLSALKVKINRESNRRVTYAWFAPDLNYSLVRLQQFKEGKEQGDIKLSAYTRP
uniref:DUF3108 domain-containing protein n=1 Tax=Ningiella ruwaisensis TaxID=2364274 RepID=UPI0010A014DB|nr:DUF3108 domain-containing protein [Ningiella ruwaisensis]